MFIRRRYWNSVRLILGVCADYYLGNLLVFLIFIWIYYSGESENQGYISLGDLIPIRVFVVVIGI